MKFKIKAKRNTPERLVVVKSDKGDELDYAEANRLAPGLSSVFLPLSYEQKGKTYCFTYQAFGHETLSEMLKRSLSAECFHAMLASFLLLSEECRSKELDLSRVAFEPDCLFFNEQLRKLRFVYVPVKSFVSVKVGINGALAYLCEHAQLYGAAERLLAQEVLSFAYGVPLFSEQGYRAILEARGVVPQREDQRGQSSFRDTDRRRTDGPNTDSAPVGSMKAYGYDFVSEQQRRAQMDAPSDQQGFMLASRARNAGWRLGRGAYTIGRAPDCSIALEGNGKLSRHHALITVDGSCCLVRDTASKNGVLVNGYRIPSDVDKPLARGDHIALGGEEFELG